MKKLFAACLWTVFSMFIVSTAYAASAQASSNPMAAKMILTQGEDSMKMTIEKVKSALASFPMRACVDLLEGLKVESNGTMMPLNRLADVSTLGAKAIEIRPKDRSLLDNIEKAILKSNIGLTPANDGKIIRLSLPSLTEERRKEMVKIVHRFCEDFRMAVRNERRQIHEAILKAEKEKKITDDDRKKAEEELEKLTDAYMEKIEEMLTQKEKEVMEV